MLKHEVMNICLKKNISNILGGCHLAVVPHVEGTTASGVGHNRPHYVQLCPIEISAYNDYIVGWYHTHPVVIHCF